MQLFLIQEMQTIASLAMNKLDANANDCTAIFKECEKVYSTLLNIYIPLRQPKGVSPWKIPL